MYRGFYEILIETGFFSSGITLLSSTLKIPFFKDAPDTTISSDSVNVLLNDLDARPL